MGAADQIVSLVQRGFGNVRKDKITESEFDLKDCPSRSANWLCAIFIGDKSYDAETVKVSERTLYLSTPAYVETGMPVIVDMRSLYHDIARVIRVCGFVRSIDQSSSNQEVKVSVDRISEKDLIFLRHFSRHCI